MTLIASINQETSRGSSKTGFTLAFALSRNIVVSPRNLISIHHRVFTSRLGKTDHPNAAQQFASGWIYAKCIRNAYVRWNRTTEILHVPWRRDFRSGFDILRPRVKRQCGSFKPPFNPLMLKFLSRALVCSQLHEN